MPEPRFARLAGKPTKGFDSLFSCAYTDYGEPRQIGYGPIGRRLHCVVFVVRGDTLRIISLRKANIREIDRYETQINSSDRG